MNAVAEHPSPQRNRWRTHALDGAVLWFHPRTGTHVRWDGPPTRAIRRVAPRVVMFGITNRCNLACGFCSRDIHAGSAWTPDGAFTMLDGLSRRGVLEVAFGGGEPLAFGGFDDLVARLADETQLAVHVTTNGVLLTPERLTRLRGRIGEIRISLYDDNPWIERIAMLAEAGVVFGANVLVTPRRLPALAPLLERLAALGCKDVALLSYVGADPSLHLGPGDDQRVARIVAESPLRARLSVCLGDRLDPVPRLFDGEGDCGAGADFIVLTSDRKLKACSFHEGGIPVETADDVLRAWTDERERLLAPAPLAGCHRWTAQSKRLLTAKPAPSLSDGIRVHRVFSGNNSGDCVLVGRFEDAEDARRYIHDIKGGFGEGSPLLAILEQEGIAPTSEDETPEAMAVLGHTAMVYTDMDADDAFPTLRTLLWKRGGRQLYAGIHEHGHVCAVAGLGFRDAAALEDAELRLLGDEMPYEISAVERRGLDLFAVLPLHADSLPGQVASISELASEHGATAAAELVPVDGALNLPAALAAPPPKGWRERLWAHFRDAKTAAHAASSLGGKVAVADRYLVIEAQQIRPRLGFMVQRLGGVAEVVTGDVMRLVASFWTKGRDSVELDPRAVGAELRAVLGPADKMACSNQWHAVTAVVDTQAPGVALAAMVSFARGRGFAFHIEGQPADRLVGAIGRIAGDLRAARRRG